MSSFLYFVNNGIFIFKWGGRALILVVKGARQIDFWGRQLGNGETALHGFFPLIVSCPFTECATAHGLKKDHSFKITNANFLQTFKLLQKHYSTNCTVMVT